MLKTSIAADRENFHRRQTQFPSVLICDLDPDPPIVLANHLRIYDQVILSALRTRGWPGTAKKTDTPPKRAKGSTLAAKIAKRNTLSAQDLDQLAARINWLQNNVFRWNARNGYADYFASRAHRGPIGQGSKDTISSEAELAEKQDSSRNVPAPLADGDGTTPRALIDPKGQLAPHQVNQGMHSGFDTREGQKEPSAAPGDPTRSSQPICSTEDDLPYRGPPHHDAGLPKQPAFDGTTEQRSNAGPPQQRTPQLPDRPKTYGAAFPITKAKNFLVANVRQSPIETQLKLGRELIEDPQQLAAALAYSEQARIDLLNAFGKLGLKTDA